MIPLFSFRVQPDFGLRVMWFLLWKTGSEIGIWLSYANKRWRRVCQRLLGRFFLRKRHENWLDIKEKALISVGSCYSTKTGACFRMKITGRRQKRKTERIQVFNCIFKLLIQHTTKFTSPLDFLYELITCPKTVWDEFSVIAGNILIYTLGHLEAAASLGREGLW